MRRATRRTRESPSEEGLSTDRPVVRSCWSAVTCSPFPAPEAPMPDFVLKGNMRISGVSSNRTRCFVPDGAGARRASPRSMFD